MAASIRLIQARRDKRSGASVHAVVEVTDTATWRMPPLTQLKPLHLTLEKQVWMGVLRAYLIIAICLVIYKVVRIAID